MPLGSQSTARVTLLFGRRIVYQLPAGKTVPVTYATGFAAAAFSPQGLATDGVGNLYVTDTANNRVVKITAGSYSGTALVCGLSSPSAGCVTVDAASSRSNLPKVSPLMRPAICSSPTRVSRKSSKLRLPAPPASWRKASSGPPASQWTRRATYTSPIA